MYWLSSSLKSCSGSLSDAWEDSSYEEEALVLSSLEFDTDESELFLLDDDDSDDSEELSLDLDLANNESSDKRDDVSPEFELKSLSKSDIFTKERQTFKKQNDSWLRKAWVRGLTKMHISTHQVEYNLEI